ncbi:MULTISPECIES: TRAP transporter substrate-binding protein [Thiomicrorhabdus]|uniref:TRAP transporter substrate-binding protein n=1 Tax=Thiomicrorhabdus heinhorstiae TaxID=2748010 RepID=A0ABS0C3K3_9GAMM|nr:MULTISPECIES: TRAP transporter substrate-binding protein [Thiomicrorhabdus]MBF6058847.1 TRAP transporter substrate-binding protein [Thiomicrorhabdus heinhorstiae]
MKRRDFIGAIAGATAATALSACGKDEAQTGAAAPAAPQKTYEWKMVTTWPKNFPGLGTGANNIARLITEMSGGRIKVKVYGAGELVGAFEVFDAVSQGNAQLGHAGAYYWTGKIPSAAFFSSVPFGLTAQEMNSWLYYGGGMELWEEAYKPFGLIPNPGGNSGTQMGGWFNKEINSVADLKGLKMRMPGLGGEVLKRAGGIPVTLPGGEIFPSLQSGAIDATEWVGPYNDLAFGLYKAAKYYYTPGWHEPGTVMECMINEKAFNELPADLQSIVRNAIKVANADMLAEYTARNQQALQTLINKHHVELRYFPDEVLKELKTISQQVVEEQSNADALSAKVWASQKAFRDQVAKWTEVSELAYLKARDL